MRDLVTYMAKGLVDEPDQVEVTDFEEDGTLVFELSVAQDDLGKVIGRQGRTAKAMRAILGAAGSKQDRRVALDILE